MIKYSLTLPEGKATVSIDVEIANQFGEIVYGGDEAAIALLKQFLPYAYGAFGHLLGSATSPIDLDAAMASAPLNQFSPEIVSGSELVQSYRSEIPPGGMT